MPSTRAEKKVTNPLGRAVSVITLDGQDVRPKDAFWVVWNPEGDPVDAFPSDAVIRDSVARAARTYWVGDTPAINALNNGWRLSLVSKRTYVRTIAARLPEDI